MHTEFIYNSTYIIGIILMVIGIFADPIVTKYLNKNYKDYNKSKRRLILDEIVFMFVLAILIQGIIA